MFEEKPLDLPRSAYYDLVRQHDNKRISPESFSRKKYATWKVFAFSTSGLEGGQSPGLGGRGLGEESRDVHGGLGE